MVIANITPKEDQFVQRDDGWWESVLADEERFVPARPLKLAVPVVVARSQTQAREPIPAFQPEDSIAPDWEHALQVYRQDQIIDLKVTGYNRGGLLVEGAHLHGFVPYSHLVDMTCEVESEREQFLARYVGRDLRLKVIECVPDEGRIVFSERAARADVGRRTEIFSNLRPGQVISGEVTNITDFGVFIDLGGVEGLIHISELSWGRVVHPSHVLKLKQLVEVQVLDILPERCRIALSLKRLQPNPWATISQRYAVRDIVPAAITSVVSFGIFARLEEGLEGLVHASEIDLPEGKTVKETFHEGQHINVCILHMEPEHQRLGLSLRLE
jgi:small subunit ribosomal protein S1